MVKTFIANIQNLPDPKENPQILENIWQERKEKILTYKFESGRKESLGSALMLQKVLSQNNLNPQNIKYGKNGKPEIEGLHFNISHAENFVICSVSENPVGCDIEKIRSIKSGFEKRFFTQNEVSYLDKFSGEEKLKQFFRLWTMKESYMKFTGEGMKLALNRFEFIIEDSVKVFRDGILTSCFIKEYEFLDYCISVCSEKNDFASNLEFVEVMNMKL